eukprot:10313929-Ditylum_brightwellii.AAC.1
MSRQHASTPSTGSSAASVNLVHLEMVSALFLFSPVVTLGFFLVSQCVSGESHATHSALQYW